MAAEDDDDSDDEDFIGSSQTEIEDVARAASTPASASSSGKSLHTCKLLPLQDPFTD